ncbi:Atrophin-1 incomplete domain containing protein [Pandoravirus neocaledonia]|uniref:Atrophin-1 incomplete domain containing protein n=1 Tax=Pandoravirus neocaledonia TaxID=2107708 RepID=A0A2U7UBU0_9VIRU|nr:Atrophin-1 incomplete domain containing protein [Pandoravirus neocaledonia]AVK75931.1 Atrophin-1 incomplete domain containing protein [Pandoravirus neocaledonia]
MEAPTASPPPYTALEEAVVDRGLADFASLGPTEMLFFVCDALSADNVGIDPASIRPVMYYYERAVQEARARADEQRAAAAAIGVPQFQGPGGNLVAFAVYMFLAQTDFAASIGPQLSEWAAANGLPDPFQSPQGLARALASVLALERPLPTPAPGETTDAYYLRALPAAVAEYLFRLNGSFAATPEQATSEVPLAPWPYYQLTIAAEGTPLLEFWWWLDPRVYFAIPADVPLAGEPGAPADAPSLADAVADRLVGLLPIAGDTDEALVANWERDYDPTGRPWESAAAWGSASDPCARARQDLNAVALSTVVVGPNQAAIAEAPLVASLSPVAAIVGPSPPAAVQPVPPPQQQPSPTRVAPSPAYRPSTAGFSVFEAPPTPLPVARAPPATEQGPRAVSAKRRRDALDAGLLAAAAMTPQEAARYPTPADIASATLASGVNPLARQPIDVLPEVPTTAGPVAIVPPPDVCLICPTRAIPSDVLDYLIANWNAWEAAGGDAQGYRDYVLDMIENYRREAALGTRQRQEQRAIVSPTAEPAARRRRISVEEAPTPRNAPGVDDIVRTVLDDAGLVNAYGVERLLGLIDAWSENPVENEFYAAFIQGQERSAGVVCRECAAEGARLYAAEQQRAPRALVAGAAMAFPFPPLPGLPLVPEATPGAFAGPFIYAGTTPVTRLAAYRYGQPTRGIEPGEEVIALGGPTRPTGYQVRLTWFDYALGHYAIERGALVFYRTEAQLYEAALMAPGAPALPLALGRVVEYDTDHFDVVVALGPGRERLGFFPTRLVVQPLLAGVEAGVVESVRVDNVYPYAAGAQAPTSQQVLEARGAPIQAQFAGGPAAAEAARRGTGLVDTRTARNLVEQRAALLDALNSPALSIASGDVERVRRLYLEIDERARALGLVGAAGPTSLSALQRAARLAGQESARQQPSSRVLAAAGRTGGGPGARASLELAAAGAAGDLGAARQNIEAALASIEAGGGGSTGQGDTGLIVGPRATNQGIVGFGAPPSPGLPPRLAPVVPGDVVVEPDGQERVLIDDRAKWDVLFGVVLTKFAVLYPELSFDVDLATRAALLAVSLVGYAVPLSVDQVARLTNPGPQPGPTATADAQTVWADAQAAQQRAVAAQRTAATTAATLPPGGARLGPDDAQRLGITFATLFRQAWDSIFDQEGLTTAARDAEFQRVHHRRLWAYPGAPNTLARPDAPPTLFATRPDRAMRSSFDAVGLALSDPDARRVYDVILAAGTRYAWSNLFAGAASFMQPGAPTAPTIDVGAALRSIQPGVSSARVHTFQPPTPRTGSIPVRGAVAPGTRVAYGGGIQARLFGGAPAPSASSLGVRPGRYVPPAQRPRPSLVPVGRAPPAPLAAPVRLPQDPESTALVQSAFVYRTSPDSMVLHVVVDPDTVAGLRRGDAAALARLTTETARVTRPVAGSLSIGDLVPVPNTSGLLYQIAGPTRGTNPALDWLRPSTVATRDLLRSVLMALRARESRPS